MVRYKAENYTGYVTWEYTSANGTSMHSSYVSSSYRTTYIYPDIFGTIQICGSISNNLVTECVAVNRIARQVRAQFNLPITILYLNQVMFT